MHDFSNGQRGAGVRHGYACGGERAELKKVAGVWLVGREGGWFVAATGTGGGGVGKL